MGKLEEHKPVKLVTSLIYKDDTVCENAEKALKDLYGSTEPAEKTWPFDFTDYYTEEMGSPLKRKVICFKDLVSAAGVAEIKVETNRIEGLFSDNSKRRVNIDPGYVTAAKLVLLTTKDYNHRVCIGKKIFAEVTLFFREGTFEAWPWTYPDYSSEEMIEYFNGIRQIYMDDISHGKGHRA